MTKIELLKQMHENFVLYKKTPGFIKGGREVKDRYWNLYVQARDEYIKINKPVERANRKCLRCDTEFQSEGIHHRICRVCKYFVNDFGGIEK